MTPFPSIGLIVSRMNASSGRTQCRRPVGAHPLPGGPSMAVNDHLPRLFTFFYGGLDDAPARALPDLGRLLRA